MLRILRILDFPVHLIKEKKIRMWISYVHNFKRYSSDFVYDKTCRWQHYSLGERVYIYSYAAILLHRCKIVQNVVIVCLFQDVIVVK